jgi:hypothetical protein
LWTSDNSVNTSSASSLSIAQAIFGACAVVLRNIPNIPFTRLAKPRCSDLSLSVLSGSMARSFRILDADADGADWQEVTQIVLHIDPEREPVRARQAYESHLIRARWMTKVGCRLLLRNGWPGLN